MSNENHSLKLSDVFLFQALSPMELASLKGCLREKSFDKGEFLFMEDQSCERIFIVQSGRVKIFRTASNGREQILEILEPGDTCACNPGSSTWCCTSTAQALTTCRVWFLARESYNRLVKTNSRLSQTLNRLFANRLCRLHELIEEVSLDDPRRRLIKFILNITNDVKRDSQDKNKLVIPLTHEEIAQRLGLVRETVTRHLHQLKRLGLIDIKPRQILVRNKEGLEKLLFDPLMS